MAFVHGFGQGIGDAGPRPHHGGLLDAQAGRDGVGGDEADAPDVAGQPVGVFGDELDRVGAIGLEDADRARRADAVGVQEQHDLADHLLVRPARDDPLDADGADAGDLAQPLRFPLDHVEHIGAEGADQLLRVDRADPPDHAGAQILLDAFRRGRHRGAQEAGLELEAMGAVVVPDAGRLDELTRRDRGGMADDGDQVAMPTRLDAEDAEPVLRIMEGHPLDQTGQNLPVGGGG